MSPRPGCGSPENDWCREEVPIQGQNPTSRRRRWCGDGPHLWSINTRACSEIELSGHVVPLHTAPSTIRYRNLPGSKAFLDALYLSITASKAGAVVECSNPLIRFYLFHWPSASTMIVARERVVYSLRQRQPWNRVLSPSESSRRALPGALLGSLRPSWLDKIEENGGRRMFCSDCC